MRIRKGPTLDEFKRLVEKVSVERYDGNLIVAPDAHENGGTEIVARIRVANGRGAGSRQSWTGRHYPNASWEAFRDVLTELFERWPNAYVGSSLVAQLSEKFTHTHLVCDPDTGQKVENTHEHAIRGYNGKAEFERLYPETAYVQLGSQMMPYFMPEMTN